jgi:hypothetical protein
MPGSASELVRDSWPAPKPPGPYGPARGLSLICNDRQGISSGALRSALVNSASSRLVCGRSRVSIDAEQCPDLDFPVPTMSTWGSDAANPPGRGPSGDSLRVNAEEGCDLSGSKQAITLPVHLRLLVRLDPPRSIFILITKDHYSPQIP